MRPALVCECLCERLSSWRPRSAPCSSDTRPSRRMLRTTVVAAAAIGALLLAANITHMTTFVRMSSLSPRLDALDVAVQQLGRDLELLPQPHTPPPPPPAVLEQRVQGHEDARAPA